MILDAFLRGSNIGGCDIGAVRQGATVAMSVLVSLRESLPRILGAVDDRRKSVWRKVVCC